MPHGAASIAGKEEPFFRISSTDNGVTAGRSSFGSVEKKRGETTSSIKTKSPGDAYQEGSKARSFIRFFTLAEGV